MGISRLCSAGHSFMQTHKSAPSGSAGANCSAAIMYRLQIQSTTNCDSSSKSCQSWKDSQTRKDCGPKECTLYMQFLAARHACSPPTQSQCMMKQRNYKFWGLEARCNLKYPHRQNDICMCCKGAWTGVQKVTVELKMIIMINHLDSIVDLISHERHRYHWHGMVCCFICAVTPSLGDKRCHSWVTKNVVLRGPINHLDIRCQVE